MRQRAISDFKWITLLVWFYTIPLIVAFRDGDVRLVNSERYGEGRVEVFFEGEWGTVCQNGWDFNDAQVICRQLGFPNGAQRTFIQARFGEGSGRVLLSDVQCQGDEETLLQCNNTVWNSNTCNHQADVGVRCNAPNYEGCFDTLRLRATRHSLTDELTFEGCFGFCSNTQYFWMDEGRRCSCGSTLGESLPVNDGCNSPCTGDADWICGGNQRASVYSTQIRLPYAASNGFPGRVQENINGDTWTFTAQGPWDYTFIQVHQFDIPSLTVQTFLDIPEMFDLIDGVQGTYLVSTDLDAIDVRYPGNSGDEEYPGFLLEFGQGTFCALPTGVVNGIVTTASIPPFTVGEHFEVICSDGFRPFDDIVFCQADGTLSRPIMCEENERPPAPPPVTAEMMTAGPMRPVTQPMVPGILTAVGRCSVPTVENGKLNATAVRQVLTAGDVVAVTCNPIYEPVNSTATCQNNGDLIPTPQCQRNETLFIILFVIVGVVALLVILLFVILVGCACYFSQRKKSRVRDYQRRNQIDVVSPYGNDAFEPPETDSFDGDTIIDLPTGDATWENPQEGGVPSVSGAIGEEEATVLQGLNDVVNDLERDNLYGKVNKPSIAVSGGGFGGHFARS